MGGGALVVGGVVVGVGAPVVVAGGAGVEAPGARLGLADLELDLLVLGTLGQRRGQQLRAVERDRLVHEVVLHLGRRVGRDAHRGVERHPGQPLGVAGADQIHAGVGHVDLGARHVALGTCADLEEAAGRAQVEVRALDGLLLHPDQALGEVDVGEGLLHRLGHELALELDVFLRLLGQAAGGAGVEAPGAVTGGGVIVPPGAGVVAGVCGVVGVGGGVTGAGTGVGVCGGSCASAAGAASSRHSKATTPARTIRMQRLPFPNTARAVSVTIAFAEHEDNTLLRDDSATRASTQRVGWWTARWTTGGGAGDIGGLLFP